MVVGGRGAWSGRILVLSFCRGLGENAFSDPSISDKFSGCRASASSVESTSDSESCEEDAKSDGRSQKKATVYVDSNSGDSDGLSSGNPTDPADLDHRVESGDSDSDAGDSETKNVRSVDSKAVRLDSPQTMSLLEQEIHLLEEHIRVQKMKLERLESMESHNKTSAPLVSTVQGDSSTKATERTEATEHVGVEYRALSQDFLMEGLHLNFSSEVLTSAFVPMLRQRTSANDPSNLLLVLTEESEFSPTKPSTVSTKPSRAFVRPVIDFYSAGPYDMRHLTRLELGVLPGGKKALKTSVSRSTEGASKTPGSKAPASKAPTFLLVSGPFARNEVATGSSYSITGNTPTIPVNDFMVARNGYDCKDHNCKPTSYIRTGRIVAEPSRSETREFRKKKIISETERFGAYFPLPKANLTVSWTMEWTEVGGGDVGENTTNSTETSSSKESTASSSRENSTAQATSLLISHIRRKRYVLIGRSDGVLVSILQDGTQRRVDLGETAVKQLESVRSLHMYLLEDGQLGTIDIETGNIDMCRLYGALSAELLQTKYVIKHMKLDDSVLYLVASLRSNEGNLGDKGAGNLVDTSGDRDLLLEIYVGEVTSHCSSGIPVTRIQRIPKNSQNEILSFHPLKQKKMMLFSSLVEKKPSIASNDLVHGSDDAEDSKESIVAYQFEPLPADDGRRIEDGRRMDDGSRVADSAKPLRPLWKKQASGISLISRPGVGDLLFARNHDGYHVMGDAIGTGVDSRQSQIQAESQIESHIEQSQIESQIGSDQCYTLYELVSPTS